MRHELDNSYRHAHNTLTEANARLDSGKVRDPREHALLMSMIRDARDVIKNHESTDNRRPYSDTNIGYDTNMRGRGRTSDDARDMLDAAMDLADRILPPLMDDDRYDVDDRRGVPGTGRRRVRRVRADRYDDRYDDDYDDDDMDDMKVYNMPRWRSARTGRFLPNLYGPRRVRRVRRRSDMDDYDDRYDRYDDDARYDDVRRMADEARRTADDARRTADEARRTADNARNTNPVDRSDRTRYDAARYDRRDDRTDDHIGPDTRR